MTFPQIPEPAATGETAAIYAALRQATGVPLVNLIWRHFAALPGVLPQVWHALAPLLGSSELAAARDRVAAAFTPNVATRPAAPDQAAEVVAAYNRGNLTNVIALTALRLRLEDPARPARTAPYIPRATEPLTPLPPLPALADLPAPLAATVTGLAAQHDGAGGGVIPSLYLALTPWPDLLNALPDQLASLYVPEALRAARAAIRQAAEQEAAACIPALPEPVPALLDALPTIRRFTTLVIPDLIPVGLALAAALSPSSRPGDMPANKNA